MSHAVSYLLIGFGVGWTVRGTLAWLGYLNYQRRKLSVPVAEEET